MIKIGPFEHVIDSDTQLFVESQVDFTVLCVVDGEIIDVWSSHDRKFKAHVREPCTLKFEVPKLMHTSVDARKIRPVHEEVSPIPVEVDTERPPLTLQDSIKAFCAQLVQHEFGRDSKEVDTFEEMMDFDILDDDDLLPVSGLEVKDTVPEVLHAIETPPGETGVTGEETPGAQEVPQPAADGAGGDAAGSKP